MTENKQNVKIRSPSYLPFAAIAPRWMCKSTAWHCGKDWLVLGRQGEAVNYSRRSEQFEPLLWSWISLLIYVSWSQLSSSSASSIVRCCGTTLCFQLQPDKSGQDMVSLSLFFQRRINAAGSFVKLLLLSIMELQIQPKHITPPLTSLLPLLLGLSSSAPN